MQVIVNGAISGLVIAILGLAFQLVYLPTKVFHVALGAIFSAAPFFVLACLNIGWPVPAAIAIGLLSAIVLSLLCEWSTHAPISKHRGSFAAHFISSLGIYTIIVQALTLNWGADLKVIRSGVDPVIFLGNLVLTHTQLWKVGGSLTILIGFYLWLQFTSMGLQFRGLADNPNELSLRGYNIGKLRLISFGVSGAMVGAAAILVARDTGFFTYGGLQELMLAVVAAIIGGRQSFAGPVIGGFILGIARMEIEWYISSQWIDISTFVVLSLFLLLRPNGIIVRKARLEAEQAS
ncbi:MAG: branched-chain amino acid ABC transporter permease [Alphaproteobacteria bacterium]|nr:branched-chain amino acid ABC transporter permease [Alphaproteobacteria bacterium]